MSLQRKLNVKSFLMFIVAENTGSVNIRYYMFTEFTQNASERDRPVVDSVVFITFLIYPGQTFACFQSTGTLPELMDF